MGEPKKNRAFVEQAAHLSAPVLYYPMDSGGAAIARTQRTRSDNAS